MYQFIKLDTQRDIDRAAQALATSANHHDRQTLVAAARKSGFLLPPSSARDVAMAREARGLVTFGEDPACPSEESVALMAQTEEGRALLATKYGLKGAADVEDPAVRAADRVLMMTAEGRAMLKKRGVDVNAIEAIAYGKACEADRR